jgi:hypothetical protein
MTDPRPALRAAIRVRSGELLAEAMARRPWRAAKTLGLANPVPTAAPHTRAALVRDTRVILSRIPEVPDGTTVDAYLAGGGTLERLDDLRARGWLTIVGRPPVWERRT